jgi:hypothetical protein
MSPASILLMGGVWVSAARARGGGIHIKKGGDVIVVSLAWGARAGAGLAGEVACRGDQ